MLPRAGQKVIVDEAAKGMTPILRMDRARADAATAAAAEGGGR